MKWLKIVICISLLLKIGAVRLLGVLFCEFENFKTLNFYICADGEKESGKNIELYLSRFFLSLITFALNGYFFMYLTENCIHFI